MEGQKMKEETANLIVEAVKFATVVGVSATDCGVNLSASLYLNIRDAMFHYKALCDHIRDEDEYDALKHYFNLKEHLIRGEKDAIIMQAQAISDSLYNVMQLKCFNELFSHEEVKKLQSYVHKIKEIILRIRIEGSDLAGERKFSADEVWAEMASYTIRVTKICEEKNVSLF